MHHQKNFLSRESGELQQVRRLLRAAAGLDRASRNIPAVQRVFGSIGCTYEWTYPSQFP